jgi:hypothetical protein
MWSAYRVPVILDMIDGGVDADGSRVSRSGGVPLVPAGLSWPSCVTCSGPMQFLVQLLPGDVPELDHMLLIFMCQNDPGLCDEWEPFGGGNRAYLVSQAEVAPAEPPTSGQIRLDAVTRLTFQPADSSNAVHALGFVGGQPDWIQNDETPTCPRCSARMGFIAQLEEGPTGMNFGGGGCGYAFACVRCLQAAFLWQCG